MSENKELRTDETNSDFDADDKIEQGFAKMELLWKSRCVKMPSGSNVTVREISKEE
jgi:hypothetical protein